MNPLTQDSINNLLDEPGRSVVYLVGAGGCGMSGLGHLLLDLGCVVRGSDLVLNEEIRQLRARGAEIDIGHDPDRLVAARPVFVVYSSAIRSNNPELLAARGNHVPILRRAVLLAALLSRKKGICIAGMHGKTTTTALLAFALEKLGADPSYAVGSLVPQLTRPARFATNQQTPSPPANGWFAVETDESDGTLREFHPEHAIVLNVDEEHLDYYASIEAVCREFGEFGAQTRGLVVFCADDPRLLGLFTARANSVSYGFHPLAAYRLELSAQRRLGAEAGSVFTVWRRAELLGEFEIRLLGEKNALNAGAVIALLHELGFAADEIAGAIRDFRGAARRQQELFRDQRFRIFDDYGHHPREIQATLSALRALGGRRLLVAFQPHRFTRTQHLLHEFAGCFQGADRLWLTDVYAASETEIPGINGRTLADAVRAHGQAVEYVPQLDQLNDTIRPGMEPGDIVLFIGAGDITQAGRGMAERLASEPIAPSDDLFAGLRAVVGADTVLARDEVLAKRTTLRVGGRADFYVEPASETELASLLEFCQLHRLRFTILGRGSNLLVRDGGVRGLVISLAHPRFSRIEFHGSEIHCGAGARLKNISVEARRHGLAGLEFLEGIPGSLGGALRMNAGAMGSWTFETVESVRFMDYTGQVREVGSGEVHVEYRGCPLFKDHIALGAVLKGRPDDRRQIEEKAAAYNQKRWSTQPAAPSAGCIFKNPAQIPAGRLIEELGLKGTRVGGASVSQVHGNFIVNEGSATAGDVLALIDLIKERARAARGIELQTEVEILGGERVTSTLRIVLMAGGPSAEREVSLRSGAGVARALRSLGHEVIEIDPVDDGWNLPVDVQVVCLSPLHGTYGEDGSVQRRLENLRIPYTGCDSNSSALAFDKVATKERLLSEGIPTPRYRVFSSADAAWPEGWLPPVVVKPVCQGSSVGLQFVHRVEDWTRCLAESLKHDRRVLMEERIVGRELTVGILEDRALPIVEVRPREGAYDYRNKYTLGATEYLCPAPLKEEVTARVQSLALRAFRSVGGRDFGRIDVLLRGDEPFILEVNTLPGMTETSLLPKAAAAAGIGYVELCTRMIDLAVARAPSSTLR